MIDAVMPIAPQPLPLPGLFQRLSEGHAARITALAPNQRLAQALQAGFDRFQLAAGRASWEAPDILPFAAFVERCHEEALYADGADGLPTLLTPAQSQLLWEEALRASRWHDRVLSLPATAALAADAWQTAHAWRIEGALEAAHGNEDAQAFAAWCAHYRRRTRRDGLVDAARLPELVAARFAAGAARPPSFIVLHGFDLLTPQQEDFLAACARSGAALARSEAPRARSQVRRLAFESPRQELEHAARWARQRLEEAGPAATPRIAVVVPRLEQQRSEVARIFARVLAAALGPGESAAALFNISLGAPLSSYALVDAALGVLELCAAPLPFDRVSRLLRSPFVGGAQAELGARARLDVALRRLAPATLSLHRLRALVPEAAARAAAPPCPQWLALLDRLSAACRDDARAPAHEWARRFTTLLDAAGFPGDRVLDSAEFQALAKWREVLGAFAALGSIAPAWSAAEARARLKRLCADTVFQPASGTAPIQVLGILESAGLAFDHLWVSGLTEEAWPLAARPHPLIAPALQRQAGIPEASAERSLEVDAALTEAWRTAAPEVLFTSARAEGDRELLPSPLIARIPQTPIAELAIADFPTRRRALFEAALAPHARSSRADTVAPALGASASPGGTAVLADQAACPFRAFAHFRLDARALETPEPGLGPAERGELLHAMMARLWSALGDQATLKATDPLRLSAMIDEAAAHAVAHVRGKRPGRLEGRFADLERERLARIAHEWLEIERSRAPFEVRMREEKMMLTAGNLRLAGRVDRVDRLLDGGLAVIDYKSGRASVSDWLGPRPDNAQLPLYALAAGDEEIRAVAFARLKIGHLGFAGLARDEGLLPGVRTVEKHAAARKQAASWSALLERWHEELEALGENFASGDARIDPKRGLATCERCDLKTLCRVHERFAGLAADGDAEEDE
jgi:probable DNA repair protein